MLIINLVDRVAYFQTAAEERSEPFTEMDLHALIQRFVTSYLSHVYENINLILASSNVTMRNLKNSKQSAGLGDLPRHGKIC